MNALLRIIQIAESVSNFRHILLRYVVDLIILKR